MEKRPASTSGHKLLSRPPPLVPFFSSWPGNLQGPGICRFLLYLKSVKHLLLSLRVELVICLQKQFYVMGIRYLKVFYANLMQKLGKFQLWAGPPASLHHGTWGGKGYLFVASGWYVHSTLRKPTCFCLIGELHGQATEF